MYDRLVHLAYGVLLYPLIYRVFQVWLPTARPFLYSYLYSSL